MTEKRENQPDNLASRVPVETLNAIGPWLFLIGFVIFGAVTFIKNHSHYWSDKPSPSSGGGLSKEKNYDEIDAKARARCGIVGGRITKRQIECYHDEFLKESLKPE